MTALSPGTSPPPVRMPILRITDSVSMQMRRQNARDGIGFRFGQPNHARQIVQLGKDVDVLCPVIAKITTHIVDVVRVFQRFFEMEKEEGGLLVVIHVNDELLILLALRLVVAESSARHLFPAENMVWNNFGGFQAFRRHRRAMVFYYRGRWRRRRLSLFL